MLVDYEAVLLDLRQYIASRPSHGQNDLRRALDDLVQKHRVPEGFVEKALRVHGITLSEQIRIQGIAVSADTSPAGLRS